MVSSNDGKPFRFWKMFFRECFVKGASGSVFGLGYIWILLDEKNRGWHDKILDSYVVDLKESERINLKRHFEKAQTEVHKPELSPVPEAEPSAQPLPDADETDKVMPEVQPVEETVIEVIPEVAEAENEAAAEETAADEVITTAETGDNIAEDIAAEDLPGKPELSMSMKKEELLEAARERGVKVSSRATKAAIIEAIEKAEETDNE